MPQYTSTQTLPTSMYASVPLEIDADLYVPTRRLRRGGALARFLQRTFGPRRAHA